MKKVDGYGQGDHYVTFKVAVPKSLTKKQKSLLQAYAELETDTPGQIMGVTFKTDGKSTFHYYPITILRLQMEKVRCSLFLLNWHLFRSICLLTCAHFCLQATKKKKKTCL